MVMQTFVLSFDYGNAKRLNSWNVFKIPYIEGRIKVLSEWEDEIGYYYFELELEACFIWQNYFP